MVQSWSPLPEKDTPLMAPKVSLLLVLLGVLLSGATYAASLGLHIEKEVILSPGHPVMPYLITRASNGDLIVAGSSGLGDFWPWVTRVNSSGTVMWDYLNGPPNGWMDYSAKGQRFYGAIELENRNILLCGLKLVGTHHTAVIVLLRGDGSFIAERPLPLERPGTPAGIACNRWGDGVAILGTVPGTPAATGWLMKLNASGDVVWQKFADYFGYGDVIEAGSGDLLVITGSTINRVGQAGDLLASRPLATAEWKFIRPSGRRSTVGVVGMLATPETEILELDEGLSGPTHTRSLTDADVKKALELQDGSVALFGSQYRNGATASVAVVSKRGAVSRWLIEPQHSSGWFYDAVPTDNPLQFATVRTVGLDAKLTWITIK